MGGTCSRRRIRQGPMNGRGQLSPVGGSGHPREASARGGQRQAGFHDLPPIPVVPPAPIETPPIPAMPPIAPPEPVAPPFPITPPVPVVPVVPAVPIGLPIPPVPVLGGDGSFGQTIGLRS